MNVIAYSRQDEAGANMAQAMIDYHGFKPTGDEHEETPVYARDSVRLVGFADSLLYAKKIPYEPDLCIVASRHRSESGKPTLTCHVTGNFAGADYGGESGRLGVAPAQYLYRGLKLLKEKGIEKNLDYAVSYEVTHHGPTLDTPLMFMEVGSTPRQWQDKAAVSAVAEAIVENALSPPPELPVGVGFGGTHYAPNFSLTKGIALGHMMPKYACQNLDEKMFLRMVGRTVPKPQYAVLDWKGLLSKHKKMLREYALDNALEIERTTNLK